MSQWTGPREEDLTNDVLRHSVPPERWPYGPPYTHQACCLLYSGGLFCDCAASSANEEDVGWGW